MPQLPLHRRLRRTAWARAWIASPCARLTHQLVRQVVQGGGNMPAYGKNLNPAEVAALVSFLDTLHPANQLPARDAAQQASSHNQ